MQCGDSTARVVLSRETPTSPGVDLVASKHVRLHQRRSAQLVSRGFGPLPTWTIDIGMAWAGKVSNEAERKQMSGDSPQYTVEVELVDHAYVETHDDAHVATSLAMKAADLLDHLYGRFNLVKSRDSFPPRAGASEQSG